MMSKFTGGLSLLSSLRIRAINNAPLPLPSVLGSGSFRSISSCLCLILPDGSLPRHHHHHQLLESRGSGGCDNRRIVGRVLSGGGMQSRFQVRFLGVAASSSSSSTTGDSGASNNGSNSSSNSSNSNSNSSSSSNKSSSNKNSNSRSSSRNSGSSNRNNSSKSGASNGDKGQAGGKLNKNSVNSKQSSGSSGGVGTKVHTGTSTGTPRVPSSNSNSSFRRQSSSETHPDIRQSDLDVNPINGVFAVFKTKGKSSAQVVANLKYALQDELFKVHNRKFKVKVGHGGTLDPMAEGVLVIGVGSGTRDLTSFLSGVKKYRATGQLGKETDTLDATGTVVREMDCNHVTLDQLNAQLPKFRGKIMQSPPAISAVHIDGERAYKLARMGKVFEIKPREVEVHNVNIVDDASDLPRDFAVEVECGGGFYVRTFILDLAKSCNAIANMSALIRTKQGQFLLSDCLNQEDWTIDNVKRAIDTAYQNRQDEVKLEENKVSE